MDRSYLPHFERGSNGAAERGFVQHCTSKGYHPRSSGFTRLPVERASLIRHVRPPLLGTQRRFMKALENIKVCWDKSARNADGMVIQFKYGDDGLMRCVSSSRDFDCFPSEPSMRCHEERAGKGSLLLKEHDRWRDPSLVGTNSICSHKRVSHCFNARLCLISLQSQREEVYEGYELTARLRMRCCAY